MIVLLPWTATNGSWRLRHAVHFVAVHFVAMTTALTPRRLAELYTDLGHQVLSHTDPTGAFGAIASVAVGTIPGTQMASITRGLGEAFVTAASTDDAALAADLLQYELNSGPCVDAVVRDSVFASGDLRSDARWNEFGPRAFESVGVVSVLSIRMVVEGGDLSAGVNLYSREADAFTDSSLTVGMLLATHGALAMAGVLARERAANLERALTSNREIGMAMGILMATYKVNRDQAFDLLRIASQNSNRKLSTIASDVVDTGTLSFPDHSPRGQAAMS
ncbi:MAG: GAF and ANTAR domain-containing protein [bacterium]